jgi:hypothetical protein
MLDVADERLKEYARWSFGYNRERTVAAARQFALGDHSMQSEFRPDACPIDPEEDMHCEQLIHPYHLAAEMRQLGFSVTVRAHLSDRYSLADRIWGWLSPLTLRFSKGFVVVGRRT